MSKSISIHDTHRIPYFNATLTAVQKGTTTPVKFVDYDGNELGYEVYSNMRGFLCDNTGTLYTSGVFVEGNSEIKCTLNDGKSTTWIVGEDNKEQINDGQVLTKSGRKLFSANSNDNWTISVQDIEDMPPLNQWKENQQIVFVENTTDSVDVDQFTKVLIVTCADVTPMADLGVYYNQFVLTLNPSANRFGQRLLVWNLTPWRLSLKNVVEAVPFTTVDPDGFTPVSLVCFNNLTQWKYVADVDYTRMDSQDGSLTLSSYVAYQGYDVQITDRTPPFLILNYSSYGLTLDNAGVLLKFSINLSKPRRIRFYVKDSQSMLRNGKNGTIYFKNYANNTITVGRYRLNEMFEIYFPTGSSSSTVSYEVLAVEGLVNDGGHVVTYAMTQNEVATVPPLVDKVVLNFADGTDTAGSVVFPNEKNSVVLEVNRDNPVGTLIIAVKNQNGVTANSFAITTAQFVAGLQLCNGVISQMHWAGE